jgi:hypothetical protein
VSLPLLAQQADLEAALQRTLDPTQAAMALRRASARVRKWCRQDFTFTAQDTVTVPGGGRILQLPQRPAVVDDSNPLTVVELWGISGLPYTAVEGRDFTRIGSELTRGQPWWEPSRLMGWGRSHMTGAWAPRVTLTYSHGYQEIPDDVADVVLGLAQMNMTNPQGLRSEAIDDYNRTFAAETIGNAELTPQMKDDLRQYRGSTFSVAPVV